MDLWVSFESTAKKTLFYLCIVELMLWLWLLLAKVKNIPIKVNWCKLKTITVYINFVRFASLSFASSRTRSQKTNKLMHAHRTITRQCTRCWISARNYTQNAVYESGVQWYFNGAPPKWNQQQQQLHRQGDRGSASMIRAAIFLTFQLFCALCE